MMLTQNHIYGIKSKLQDKRLILKRAWNKCIKGSSKPIPVPSTIPFQSQLSLHIAFMKVYSPVSKIRFLYYKKIGSNAIISTKWQTYT